LAICKQLPDCLHQYANAGLISPIMRITQAELDQLSETSSISASTMVALEVLDCLAASSELKDESSLILNETKVTSYALHLGNLVAAGASDFGRTDRSSADQGGSQLSVSVHSTIPH